MGRRGSKTKSSAIDDIISPKRISATDRRTFDRIKADILAKQAREEEDAKILAEIDAEDIVKGAKTGKIDIFSIPDEEEDAGGQDKDKDENVKSGAKTKGTRRKAKPGKKSDANPPGSEPPVDATLRSDAEWVYDRLGGARRLLLLAKNDPDMQKFLLKELLKLEIKDKEIEARNKDAAGGRQVIFLISGLDDQASISPAPANPLIPSPPSSVDMLALEKATSPDMDNKEGELK